MGMETQATSPLEALKLAHGGNSGIARLLGDISPQAVSQWRTNGIPRAQMKYLRAVRPEVFATIGSQLPTRSAA